MIRTNKVTFRTDSGRELVSLENGKGLIHAYSMNQEELEELALACQAAAEELRAYEQANTNDGVLTTE